MCQLLLRLEKSDHLEVVAGARYIEGRQAFLRGYGGIGTGFEEKPNDFQIAATGGDDEWRIARYGDRVRFGTGLEKQTGDFR